MTYQIYFSNGVICPLERMQERENLAEPPGPELWEIRPFGRRTEPVYSKLVGNRDDARVVMNKLRELSNPPSNLQGLQSEIDAIQAGWEAREIDTDCGTFALFPPQPDGSLGLIAVIGTADDLIYFVKRNAAPSATDGLRRYRAGHQDQ